MIRNAGGVVTEDEIRSLAISQRLLGTEEIILIHHTDCGMLTFTDDGFRGDLQRETGIKPTWSPESFTDLDDDVRSSIGRIKGSPFIPHKDSVRGFVYDVHTGTAARGHAAASDASVRSQALRQRRAQASSRAARAALPRVQARAADLPQAPGPGVAVQPEHRPSSGHARLAAGARRSHCPSASERPARPNASTTSPTNTKSRVWPPSP